MSEDAAREDKKDFLRLKTAERIKVLISAFLFIYLTFFIIYNPAL